MTRPRVYRTLYPVADTERPLWCVETVGLRCRVRVFHLWHEDAESFAGLEVA